MAEPARVEPAGRALPVIEKYDVLEAIGAGGMATVYRAHDTRLARDVALKVIHPHLRSSAEVAHRFTVEARAVAKLRHPGIVEVFDVSAEGEGERYLVQELLEGPTLRKLLETAGAFPPEIAASFAIDLLAALAHAHAEGIVHRDVKPENVILGGSPTRIKLTDFGIAKLLDAQGVTSTGQVLGSPAHMAPEQIEGGEVDARADVFGIGVLLYECVVGKLPFRGTNPAQVLRKVLEGTYAPAEREAPTVGRRISAIIDRALALHPVDRYASADEMRAALEAELDRVGFADRAAEIRDFCADPTAYREALTPRLVAKLKSLGDDERKGGDAVGAASDYNRALAYAPDDKALLRLITGMRAAERRARIAKRAAPIAGLVVVAVVAGIGVHGWAKRPGRVATIVPTPSASASITAAPVAPADASIPVRAVGPGSPVRVAPAPAPAPVPRVLAQPVVNPASPDTSKGRSVILASVRPEFGVSVAVDDGPPVSATTGGRLPLDGKPHVLTFSCASDACEKEQQVVQAGGEDESIAITMRVRPATLVVDGDPAATYRVQEEPGLVARSGRGIAVPFPRGGVRVVHVVEDPSSRVQVVTLHAGKETRVPFGVSPPSPSP